MKNRKLLIHACCAPCAIYPVEEAKKDGFDVTAFFYNPNIHPYREHDRRKSECEKFFKSEDLKMISPEYGASDYFTKITEDEDPPSAFAKGENQRSYATADKSPMEKSKEAMLRRTSPPERCAMCWDIRMEKSAVFAKEKKFDLFTTTLLGSPYQDHETLREICERLSKEKRIDFYYKDFREGFRAAHKLAKGKGMYCQNYCGCVFSIVERQEACLKSR